jgi:mono/diheme cytochrome c family protein
MANVLNSILFLQFLVVALTAGERAVAGSPTEPSRAESDFFERRIRPVLAANCLKCHGPNGTKAGLRLDSREGLLKGSETGAVVTPGSPDESLLIEAVRRGGPLKMPPKDALSHDTVADLETWVRMGLPWPEGRPLADETGAKVALREQGWAFQPVHDMAHPRVKDVRWPRTSIDSYVLAALEARGLTPSAEADRRTLIRRATLDLLGLPPTPDEVESFVNDRAADAYEHLLDRLLASPHYGERWGRHWLDVARYADTKGYVFFEDPNFPWAYTYRDYVIDRLNDDVPYDSFLVEQIAADRLAFKDGEWRGRSLAALGFLSLGGRFMNNAHDIIDDRIDVVTRGLMGLTVTCARCHDHKFDPISASDYYALYGVFASTVEPADPPLLDPPPSTPDYRAFAKELTEREKKLADFLATKRVELASTARSRAAEYLLAAHAARDQPVTDDFMLIADQQDLNPSMVVRWRSYLERTRRAHHPVFAPWHALTKLPEADFSRQAALLCERLASDANRGPRVNALVAEALAASPPRTIAEAARTYASLLSAAEALGQEHVRRARHNGSVAGPLPIPAHQELWEVFHGPGSPVNVDVNTLNNLELLPDRASQARFQELQKAVETWRTTGRGSPPRAMSLADAQTLVEPRVFLRGNPSTLGATVPRRFPLVLSGPAQSPFQEGSGRLELARSIASMENPLTARVLVNRVWMHHFGTPLVATPGDFGLRSDPPSNPGLLDHLAYTFMHEDAWSLKALHRRIMLSAAYRQASDDRPAARAIDPENSLYWRMNRRRLDFESQRDATLAVSGRLDRTIGGPPFNDVSAAPTSPARRTLYGKIDRLNLGGIYRTFDFPDPNATSPKRDETTVPPQALFLMNHAFNRAAAKALMARPDVLACPDPSAKTRRLYQILYGRSPTDREQDLASAFVTAPEGGWDRFAQALLLSNEFAFID